MKSSEAVLERIERERHEMLAFIGNINAGLPDGVNVAPCCMIPEECWNGRCGDFLARCLELSPCAPGSMLPLARDQKSAVDLGIRKHPGVASKNFLQGVEGVLKKLENEAKASGDAFQRAIETMDMPNWDAMADIVDLTAARFAARLGRSRRRCWGGHAEASAPDVLQRSHLS